MRRPNAWDSSPTGFPVLLQDNKILAKISLGKKNPPTTKIPLAIF